MALLSVPIVDMTPYFSGTPQRRAALAREIDAVCRDIGFLVITNHGISPALIERVSTLSRQFFELPLAEKRRVDRPRDDAVRGFSAVGEEGLSYSLEEKAPGDLKESFSIGPTEVPDDAYHRGPAAGAHFEPNVWPALPGLREAYTEYFAAMSDLSRSLMRLFALALSLPEHFFDDKIDRHISMFRVLSYPPQKEPPLPGQLRAGAHSDYGSLTIVLPDDAGLQVFNKAGEWVDVPLVEGGLVVNIADLMMQWTNDQWVSTLHRVVNPPFEAPSNRRRQSLVFFHQPNYDAMVSCLPACLAPGEAPRYAPISSGDHLTSKFVKQTTFGGTKTGTRSMARLSYVNVFARDVVALSGFYQQVFGFTEIESIRSPIFRGLETGKSCLGFNAPEAYELLHLAEHADTRGVKFLLNIDVDSKDEVDRMVPVAVAAGATLVKPSYETYYHWYQAVLLDPEGNVFRINFMM